MMVNLVTLYLLRISEQTHLFHYAILNLFLTCSSFLSSFFLIVFIKTVLIQKGKCTTNLNHDKRKQEETTIDYN